MFLADCCRYSYDFEKGNEAEVILWLILFLLRVKLRRIKADDRMNFRSYLQDD